MEEKSRTTFIVIIALILAAAVVYSFSAGFFHSVPSVGLAPPDPGPSGGEPSADPFADLVQVEVTPETVQDVIATLNRYSSYGRTVTVEYFSGEAVIGGLTATVAVDGGWTRADVQDRGGMVEHTVIGDDTRWLWFDDSTAYVCTPAAQGASDLVQRIPTYEDVLALDKASITAASYERRGELPCIYVEVLQPELDYLERFWVSVESGLLVSSETWKNGEMVYRMTSYEAKSPLYQEEPMPGADPAPDEGDDASFPIMDAFILPDGTVLHQVGG